MKRIVFSKKYFERRPDMDFGDDGNHFRIYFYKGILPISVCSYQEDRFIDIRLDYLGIDYRTYKEDFRVLDEFNGVNVNNFNMDKLIENCEYIIAKYLNKEEEIEEVEVVPAVVEEAEPTPEEKRNDFIRAIELCKQYDRYTMYIESYSQELEARARNEVLDEEFNSIMNKYGIKSDGVPYQVVRSTNNLRDTIEDLKKYVLERKGELNNGKSHQGNERTYC